MTRSSVIRGVAIATLLVSSPAHPDPATCEKTIIGALRSFKKTHLKAHGKCLDAENVGKISGPCPDAAALLRIQTSNAKAVDKIGAGCSQADLTALGFSGSCDFEPGAQGAEGQCAVLPATTPQELAECLKCWKSAALTQLIAVLYASHASELCGGDLGATSPGCSPLDCASPLPAQSDLGDSGENDCQRAIGKVGIKYFLTREKVLEKCGLAGATRNDCLSDLKVQIALDKAEVQKEAGIKKKCGNRDPVADPPFCCRTGTGNACMLATSRQDCIDNLGGTVQEGKECVAGSCSPTPGMSTITWWESCPDASCGTTPLSSLDDLIVCVDSTADGIADRLLCLQLGTGWCP